MTMTTEQIVAVIQALTANQTPAPTASASHPFVGRYVIARCRDAGVHAGILVSASGRTAHLKNARRLWKWRVPMGAGDYLSGLSTSGIDAECSKVGELIELTVHDVAELIPCSDSARESIESAAVSRRTR